MKTNWKRMKFESHIILAGNNNSMPTGTVMTQESR